MASPRVFSLKLTSALLTSTQGEGPVTRSRPGGLVPHRPALEPAPGLPLSPVAVTEEAGRGGCVWFVGGYGSADTLKL